ncbi:MAG TPA: TIM barrel protein [Candidatus Acidoferrum sp.]|nr:TIM barrel protein [Candidatus Acidoferrum sp.]
MKALFGPAGNPDKFYEAGHKSTMQIPKYLADMGLTAYEYQCGRGVNVGLETARKFGEEARAFGITLSLHAPYYISLSSPEADKRDNSINYILESARAADAMGARRIIIHSGAAGKMSREAAMELARDTLYRAQQAVDAEGLGHVSLCPETMGKINQLGTLEEVLSLCGLDPRMIPCIDFGHLNARTLGGIAGAEDYEKILDAVGRPDFHVHFSKIEYTQGGEKRHLTFTDDLGFGPPYEPLADLIAKRGATPTIICESAGTQDIDAKTMMEVYEACRQE